MEIPAQDEFTSNGVIVNVPGGLAPGHDIVTDDVTSEIGDSVEIDGEKVDVLVGYDINFFKDGEKADVNGRFTVRLPIPNEYLSHKEKHLMVIHIAGDGTITIIEDAYRDGDHMVFDVAHFSIYAIISIAPSFAWLWWLLAIVAILIIIALVVVIILMKRKKDDNEPITVAVETPTETAEEPAPEAQEAIEATAEPEKTPEMVENVAAEPTEETPAIVEAETAETPTVDEEPIEETPEEVEETPVVVEAVAAEAPEVVEEAPEAVEEAPEVVEEAIAEAPAPETAPEPEISVEAPVVQSESLVIENNAKVVSAVVDGEVVQVRLRHSMKSRLTQTDDMIKAYYSAIKNHLLSYKRVKSRESWNYEAFNKGRIRCAQINVRGKTLIVNLNLDPKEFNVSKYHFVDMSAKPKFAKTPMMMKVRSDRALKYTIELIDEVMKKLEIPQGEIPTVDYRMPYETTEELIKRDLVKVMLPEGVVLSDDMKLVHTDISKHIEDNSDNTVKAEAPKVVEETPEVAEEAPAVVEEAAEVVEEAPEVVEEATEVVEETPEVVEETPAEHVELHVDAVTADKIISNEEAEASIEIIHTGVVLGNKMGEINLDVICENFEDGDTVDIRALRAKKLVAKNVGKIKVLARGTMTKKLIIIANKFSLQAVKMITLAGGKAELDV